MADEFSGSGPSAVDLVPPEHADPILEVTGISATEITRRCSEMRGSGRVPATRTPIPRAVAWRAPTSDRPRLLDFADLGDADFVREAHRVLLGRSGSPADLERRLAELRAGRSRMEIVVRLALCPEARRARRPRVRGVGLPTLAATGAVIEALRASATLGPAAARSERAVRFALARPPSPNSRKLLVAGAALAVAAAARRRRGS